MKVIIGYNDSYLLYVDSLGDSNSLMKSRTMGS